MQDLQQKQFSLNISFSCACHLQHPVAPPFVLHGPFLPLRFTRSNQSNLMCSNQHECNIRFACSSQSSGSKHPIIMEIQIKNPDPKSLGVAIRLRLKKVSFRIPRLFFKQRRDLAFWGLEAPGSVADHLVFLYHSIIITSGHKNPRNVAFPVHQKMHLRKPFDARLPGNCATALPRAYHNPACNKSSRPSQVSDLARSSGQKLGELVQN